MAPGTSLDPGVVIGGDFVVLRLIGQGGMGAVYVTEQKSTGKLRALKVMHREMAPDAGLLRRFEQEAKVGGLIKSGHVVEVIAAGVDDARGTPFLVMELLEGVDLRRHLILRGALPAAEVRSIFEQLCHGVGAAHAAGIVHRDLKPENIFLATPSRAGTLDSVVKVLDFGIAKIAAEAATKATAPIGSPLYMAPEQTAPGPVTPAADVWALGLIAYELLAGEHFWRSAAEDTPSPIHLLREVVLDAIPTARERGGARLPVGFDAWFARCVTRAPAERYASATEAWEGMQSFLPPSPRTFPPRVAADVLAPTLAAPDAVITPAALLGDTGLAMAGGRAELASAPPPPSTSSRRALVLAAVVLLCCGVAGYIGRELAPAPAPRATIASALPVPAPSPPPSAAPPPSAVVVASAAPPSPATVSGRSVTSSHTSHRAASHERAGEADEDPALPAVTLADGFGNPRDVARPQAMVNAPTKLLVAGHHVRVLTRLVKNESNVASAVVREAVDHSSWEYLRCYEGEARKAAGLTDGVVTLSFDIDDQLPRRARLESTTFASASMATCVVDVLRGQTINAAGPDGKGHVVYGFRFTVDD